ncbi:MAG: hypothetical protein Q7S21_01740 [archaeon]|nr:hypothetical protein [archaeon]
MSNAKIVLLGLIILFVFLSGCTNTAQVVVPTTTVPKADESIQQASDNLSYQIDETNPTATQFIIRQQYFEEAFKPKRDEYKIFEKTAKNMSKPVEQIPELFGLKSEQEIWGELPPIPADFSETAYILAAGRYYSIGLLEEPYFLQPEFYPNFKTQALRYWINPDATSWIPQGYGTYPAYQSDTLVRGDREEFIGVVFFHTSWGVQGYQGTTIVPTSETLKYFDITISPDTFLLGATFPKFNKQWAQKVVIQGKLKPDTPPGVYSLGFNIISPPKEFAAEWEKQYKLLYFSAASSIKPTGYPVQFDIFVQ